jgi:hypothetical protein
MSDIIQNGLFQNLFSAFVIAMTLFLIQYFWRYILRRKIPVFMKTIIPIAIPLFSITIVLLWTQVPHYESATTPSNGDRLTVYVSRLEGDTPSNTIRNDVISSIKKQLNTDLIDVLPAGESFVINDNISEDAAYERIKEETRSFLLKNNGDMLVWGKVSSFSNSSVAVLRFVGINSDNTDEIRANFDDYHLTDPGEILTRMFFALSFVPLEDGHFSQKFNDRYISFVKKMEPIIRRFPESIRGTISAQLCRSVGKLDLFIWNQNLNDVHLVEAARDAFESEKKEYSLLHSDYEFFSDIEIVNTMLLISINKGDIRLIDQSIDILLSAQKEYLSKHPDWTPLFNEYMGAAFFAKAVKKENDGNISFYPDSTAATWARGYLNSALSAISASNKDISFDSNTYMASVIKQEIKNKLEILNMK